MNFEGAKKFILNKLNRELDSRLTYHSVAHTMDVCQSARRIATMEGIGGDDALLLQTAALYHDSGMLITYVGHEEASISIINDILPRFNYTPEDIRRIGNMIITTKLPQSAREKLGMILCDADLDYLGREDYYLISHQLKYEWDVLGIYPTTLLQWYQLQVKFIGSHSYFTPSAISTREEMKQKHLNEIKDFLDHENHRMK